MIRRFVLGATRRIPRHRWYSYFDGNNNDIYVGDSSDESHKTSISVQDETKDLNMSLSAGASGYGESLDHSIRAITYVRMQTKYVQAFFLKIPMMIFNYL